MGSRESQHVSDRRAPRWRRITFGGVVAAVSIVAACNGGEDTCASPRAESPTYPGDPSADPGNQATWLTGIEVNTVLPPDAAGLVAGHKDPTNPDAEWDDSKPLNPDNASNFFLRIGRGAVQFSTYVAAPEGSPACDQPPQSDFIGPQPVNPLIEEGSIAPQW
jgi:hypothetical protein